MLVRVVVIKLSLFERGVNFRPRSAFQFHWKYMKNSRRKTVIDVTVVTPSEFRSRHKKWQVRRTRQNIAVYFLQIYNMAECSGTTPSHPLCGITWNPHQVSETEVCPSTPTSYSKENQDIKAWLAQTQSGGRSSTALKREQNKIDSNE